MRSYEIILPCIFEFFYCSAKKSLQKSPSGTISILVTPPVRLMVRMRMRKMRFNRNAISIFYGYLVFCFFPSTMPVRGSKPGKLSDNDSCPTFCGRVYDVKSTNWNLTNIILRSYTKAEYGLVQTILLR